MGLDNLIYCYDIKYPDIIQDFDAKIEITSKKFPRFRRIFSEIDISLNEFLQKSTRRYWIHSP